MGKSSRLSLLQVILSVAFGMLVILVDFNDPSPLSKDSGNLDTILGSQYWHPLEIIYPTALIAIFVIFYFVSRRGLRKPVLFPLILLAILVAILAFAELDDISNVLGLHLSLSLDYRLAMEGIFPLGSFLCFVLLARRVRIET